MSARRWDHTRTGRVVLAGLWIDALLVMAASAWNGGRALEILGDPFWFGVLLGFAVDVGLAVALVGDRALHLAGRPEPWGRALRVTTAVMSLALNCAVPAWLGHWGLAFFHAFLPVLLILLSEYAQASTLAFNAIADEHATAVTAEREAQLAAERAAWEAEQARQASAARSPVVSAPSVPIGPTALPAFRAVPNRPVSGSVDRPADRTAGTIRAGLPTRTADRPTEPTRPGRPGRSADRPDSANRNGPARKQTGKPRTDADLSKAVRELAEQAGGPPSQYQLKSRFGIGSGRAARLLAELAERTPGADPATNGTARKEEGTR